MGSPTLALGVPQFPQGVMAVPSLLCPLCHCLGGAFQPPGGVSVPDLSSVSHRRYHIPQLPTAPPGRAVPRLHQRLEVAVLSPPCHPADLSSLCQLCAMNYSRGGGSRMSAKPPRPPRSPRGGTGDSDRRAGDAFPTPGDTGGGDLGTFAPPPDPRVWGSAAAERDGRGGVPREGLGTAPGATAPVFRAGLREAGEAGEPLAGREAAAPDAISGAGSREGTPGM